MATFEGSSCFTSKVTALFGKVPTPIFVDPVQCPCKSVKMENDVTSSRIHIFTKIWTGSVFTNQSTCFFFISIVFFNLRLEYA